MLLLWVLAAFACAQDSPIVCTNGEGEFSAKFETGVTVTVDATKRRGLAERSCEAALVSGNSRLTVVEGAAEVDVDLMGADLGLGGPVVAIQFRKSELEKRTTYEIYSLKKTPQLLRILRGSALFSAADYKLDGKIDIRTEDAAAVDGFEGIPLRSFDFVPPVFLRFEKQKLVDVSAEYGQEFDRRIAALKAELDRAALSEFRHSDGMLATGFTMPMEEYRALVMVKIRVLEIVWAYLYSGREDEAWHALSEMWPTADMDRIRVAMLDARKRGMRNQVDEVSTSGPRRVRQLAVFQQAATPVGNGSVAGVPLKDNAMSLEGAESGGATGRSPRDLLRSVDSNPSAIYMREECVDGACSMTGRETVLLDLVVDDAGKVRSAKVDNATLKWPGVDALVKSVLRWKFIPATKMGHAVACEIKITAWLYQ